MEKMRVPAPEASVPIPRRKKHRLSRKTVAALSALGLLGVAAVQACSAGGADPSFWDPGGEAPPAGNGGSGGAPASSSSTGPGATTSSSSTGSGHSASSSSSGHASSSTTTTAASSSHSSSSSTTTTTAASSSSSSGAVTWTEIYDTVFGPSGTSTCSGGSCHTNSRNGFACGTTATSCYQGLVNAGYITSSGGASSSALVEPSQSPLCGNGFSGNMPRNHSCITAAQLTEIKAWLATGAPDN
jgi:hypothetical protein